VKHGGRAQVTGKRSKDAKGRPTFEVKKVVRKLVPAARGTPHGSIVYVSRSRCEMKREQRSPTRTSVGLPLTDFGGVAVTEVSDDRTTMRCR
jgi:hypothetical protein